MLGLHKKVDDSVHVFCAFLKDLCRLLLHCDSSAESCAPSRTDSPGGTGMGGRLALHFVTSRKSWTHHTRLHWPHRTWWPLALLPAAVRAAPGVPQRRDREPAARHALPRPGSGRWARRGMRVKERCFTAPLPLPSRGRRPGRAQYRVQTAVYVKRQSG